MTVEVERDKATVYLRLEHGAMESVLRRLTDWIQDSGTNEDLFMAAVKDEISVNEVARELEPVFVEVGGLYSTERLIRGLTRARKGATADLADVV